MYLSLYATLITIVAIVAIVKYYQLSKAFVSLDNDYYDYIVRTEREIDSLNMDVDLWYNTANPVEPTETTLFDLETVDQPTLYVAPYLEQYVLPSFDPDKQMIALENGQTVIVDRPVETKAKQNGNKNKQKTTKKQTTKTSNKISDSDSAIWDQQSKDVQQYASKVFKHCKTRFTGDDLSEAFRLLSIWYDQLKNESDSDIAERLESKLTA